MGFDHDIPAAFMKNYSQWLHPLDFQIQPGPWSLTAQFRFLDTVDCRHVYNCTRKNIAPMNSKEKDHLKFERSNNQTVNQEWFFEEGEKNVR